MVQSLLGPMTAKRAAQLWRLQTLRLSHLTFQEEDESRVLEREFAGYKLYLDVSRSNAQRLLYLQGERFVEEKRLVERLVQPGMTIVDVGANIGYFMLLFVRYAGEPDRITCFEPGLENVKELKRNRRRNALTGVDIVQSAVGDKNKEVSFTDGKNGKVEEAGSLTVPQTTLDSHLDGPVDFIKIDVEGYEGAVLEGTLGTIKECHPILLVEVHPQLSDGHSHEDIFGLLEKEYESVKYYELNMSNIWGKISYNYLGYDPIVRIKNRDKLLADCMEGRRESTFWAVCQN